VRYNPRLGVSFVERGLEALLSLLINSSVLPENIDPVIISIDPRLPDVLVEYSGKSICCYCLNSIAKIVILFLSDL
jgi:hypothetical protein